MQYPKRDAYFANRFIRLLTKTCTANEIGTDAFSLLVNVVMTEDAKRYTAAVTFTNEQLMPICGFGSKDRLNRARVRASDAGWLNYEPGRKGVPGRYWVTIPDYYAAVPDGSSDGLSIRVSDTKPADAEIGAQNATESAPVNRRNPRPQSADAEIGAQNPTESAPTTRRNPRHSHTYTYSCS